MEDNDGLINLHPKKKYGLFNQCHNEGGLSTYRIFNWRTIRNLWPTFKSNICFTVGSRLKISFWDDAWTRQTSLKDLSPGLNSIILQQKPKSMRYWTNKDGIFFLGKH